MSACFHVVLDQHNHEQHMCSLFRGHESLVELNTRINQATNAYKNETFSEELEDTGHVSFTYAISINYSQNYFVPQV